MSEQIPDRVDEFVEDYLLYLADHKGRPSLEHLDRQERIEAIAIMRILDASWGYATVAVPPLATDALAIELGITEPPPTLEALSGPAVKAARMRSRKPLRSVVDGLVTQGVAATTQQIFNLEQAAITPVTSSLARALATLLGVELDSLRSADHPERRTKVDSFLVSSRFTAIIMAWARNHNVDVQKVKMWVSSQLLTGAYRSKGDPTEDDLDLMVTTLLDTWDE